MCNPGAPINAHYINWVGQLKMTSVLTSNFVNEARFSFHRDIEDNTDPTPILSCSLPNGGAIIPLINNGAPCGSTLPADSAALAQRFPELNVVPILDDLGVFGGPPWSQGGNFAMISSNYINTFQYADQISWTHGKQTIRAGFEAERVQYNNTIPASGRGEVLVGSTADFLTASSGVFGPTDGSYNDGTPATVNGTLGGFALKGPLIHYNRINAFSAYFQDDIKVNRKLTVNAGVRWEYDGFPSDKIGQFTNVWNTLLAKYNTGSAFLTDPAVSTICPDTGHPVGTLIGFLVPSNFDKTAGFTGPCGASGVTVNSNKTLLPGSPWHNFAPRLGFAWQPFNEKFVIRGGYGWFYDRVYGNLLVDNQLNLPPYAGTAAGVFPNTLFNSLHSPWYASSLIPLGWTPRYIQAFGPGAFADSDLGYTSDAPIMGDRLPLVQLYNLGFQYEFAHNWLVDVGYVGSHSIHLYNYGQTQNFGRLVDCGPRSSTCNGPSADSGPQNLAMLATAANPLPFNDPANTNPVTTNVIQCFPCGFFGNNADLRSQYLGFNAGALATTTTSGDALYNSLQIQVRHNFSHGLLLQAAYTWSKEFTNVNAAQSGGFLQPNGGVLNGSSNSNNPLDLHQSYGLAAFERPQRLVISYVYNLPSKHTEGIAGKVMSGWSLSGVTTIQSGQPFTVTDGAGASIYGLTFAGSRALLANPVACGSKGCKSGIPLATSGSDAQRAVNGWINPAAFISMCQDVNGPTSACGLPGGNTPLPQSSPYCLGGVPNLGGDPNASCGSIGSTFPGAGTGFGNSRVGNIFGPDQVNFDMALAKDTKIWEGGTLQFRAEGFNIWNHTQFNPPGNNVNLPSTFGLISSTANTARVFQFALKLLF